MKPILFLLSAISLPLWSQSDCKEPNYLNNINGFKLASCVVAEFNEFEFLYYDHKGNYVEMKRSGKYFRLNYEKESTDSRNLSGEYIRQNYLNAVLKAKGENLSRDKDVFKFSNEGKSIYMKIDNALDNDDQGYQVYIVEEASMTQEIELSVKEALDKDGRLALYGIFFDTNKANILPESEREINRVLDFLKTNPAMNIYIVGHTDNTGDFSFNLTLSKQRGQSVMNYLISKGVANNRLAFDGVGSLSPITTNKTPEGRKMNRRVEIVLK